MAQRPSSIDSLPGQVREALHSWLRDPGISQTEATARANALLEELELPTRITRRSVSRYDARMQSVGRRIQESRQVAEVWIAKLGSAPGGRVGHLVSEMLRTLAFDLAGRLTDSELKPEDLPGVIEAATKLSLMAQRLERSSEISERREREIRRAAAEELAAKAEEKTRREKRPMTPEEIKALVREIYGA